MNGPFRFVAPHLLRSLTMLMFLAAMGATVVGAVIAVRADSAGASLYVIVPTLVSIVLFALLQTNTTQVVTVDHSIVEIHRSNRHVRFDLCDPDVQILVRDGEIAFAHCDQQWISVSSQEVDWGQFSRVVMHYQALADAKADQRARNYRR